MRHRVHSSVQRPRVHLRWERHSQCNKTISIRCHAECLLLISDSTRRFGVRPTCNCSIRWTLTMAGFWPFSSTTICCMRQPALASSSCGTSGKMSSSTSWRTTILESLHFACSKDFSTPATLKERYSIHHIYLSNKPNIYIYFNIWYTKQNNPTPKPKLKIHFP